MSKDKVKIVNLLNEQAMNDQEQSLDKKIAKSVIKTLPYATTFALIASGFVMKDVVENFSLTRLQIECANHPYTFLIAGVLGIMQLMSSSRKTR